jgi:hypothetical protein
MSNLDKDFVKYPEAFELKGLGFDEPCLKWYSSMGRTMDSGNSNQPPLDYACSKPTYSQAFRWFREKYKLGAIVAQFGWGIENELGQIIYDVSDGKTPSCYEESELDCLVKLIEIVKEKETRKP